ncbi:no significant blast hit [Histoplasma capsulatum G186AR]|uniref:Uncharacterized protein n=1 Tax=Ajellomyces capsulatus TaxID=5037 RepID=A0A8H7Z630_AJECA|nr:hypothetical protein I7I52_00134 [Histoplasma capsulatum]QSS72129.1 no significant blast hit [Histoplasma capsulatum G186AR]
MIYISLCVYYRGCLSLGDRKQRALWAGHCPAEAQRTQDGPGREKARRSAGTGCAAAKNHPRPGRPELGGGVAGLGARPQPRGLMGCT